MSFQGKTTIIRCNRCGLLVRHELRRREQRRLLGKSTVEGWVCTKCGSERGVRAVEEAGTVASKDKAE